MPPTPDVRVRLSAEGVAEVVAALKKIEAEGGKTSGKARRGFKGLNGVLKQTSKMLGAVGIGFTALAAIRFATNQVRELKRWETSWAEVRTIISGTRGEIAATETRVRALASIIPKEHSLLAKGFYQVLSSGITKAAEAINFLRIAAKAATGGITEVETAVDVGTTILNAYGEELDQTERIFDVLFTTVREGKVTFPELAQSLGTAVPFFAQANIEIEQLAASVATLTKGGLRAEIATTALRTMIVSLLKPTDEALAVAKDLGLEFNITAVAAKGLVPWLKEMQEATGGSTEKITKLFPEVRGLNAVLSLSGKQWQEYARILDVVRTDSIGASQAAFDRINETAEAQDQLVRNRLKNAWIDLGAGVLQGTKNAAKALGDLLPESFEMQAERLGAVYRQLQRIEGRGRELVRVYRELERASDGTAEAQVQVRRAMEDLASAFPEVISEVDEFGNVLAINVDNLDEYYGAVRRVLDLETRGLFEETAEKAGRLAARLAWLSAEYNELAKRDPTEVYAAADKYWKGAPTVQDILRGYRTAMDEMSFELEALNAELARVLISSGLAAEVVAFEELAAAVEAGTAPAGALEAALDALSPQIRALLRDLDPAEMQSRLRGLAGLLRSATEMPTPGPAAEAPGETAAEMAARQADLAIAARDRERSAAKLHARLRTEEERRQFDAGLQSAREYFADRQAIATEAYEAELAALRSKITLLERESDHGKRLKAQAAAQAEISKRRLEYDAARAKLAEEERKALEQLASERLGFERALLEAQGRRHEVALAEIDEQIAKYERVLLALGLSHDEIAGELEKYRATFVSLADFEEAEGAAQAALKSVGIARAEIQRQVDAGMLSTLEGERQIAEIERGRVPALREIAASMMLAAEAIGDPARIAEVQAFVAAIDQLGLAAGRVDELGTAVDNLGANIREAGLDAFTESLAGIGRETQKLMGFLRSFAKSFGESIQQLLARMAALKVFDLIGLKGGGEVRGYSKGGSIVGPGTGTSDSLMAAGPGGLLRLSSGEFVVRSRETQRPWGLEFLERYNRGEFDPREILSSLHARRFALGGLISGGLATPNVLGGGPLARISSSSMPASSPASSLGGRLTIGLEDGLVARTIDSPDGDRIILKSIARNRRSISRLL